MTENSPRFWSGRFGKRILDVVLITLILSLLLLSMGIISFQHFQPAKGTKSIDQLVADLPETLKFARVQQGPRDFIVWIGRPRGPTVSGPPVYVFDKTGVLVDYVSDAGDCSNTFVKQLYDEAFHSKEISSNEAIDFCTKGRR